MLIIWGLRVIYRTLGQGVFFCRRCGGDREYQRSRPPVHHGLLYPADPAGQDGRARAVPDLQDQVRRRSTQAAHHGRYAARALRRDARPGRRHAPRRRPATRWPAAARSTRWSHGGAGLRRGRPRRRPRRARPRPRSLQIAALGGQLQIEAKEWYLAEAIRITRADGPLTGPERAAAVQLATALGMTQAQAIGVIALTGQNAGQN